MKSLWIVFYLGLISLINRITQCEVNQESTTMLAKLDIK